MPAKRCDYLDNPSLCDRFETYPAVYRGYEPLLRLFKGPKDKLTKRLPLLYPCLWNVARRLIISIPDAKLISLLCKRLHLT
jgi:hypothetical protein